MDVKLIITPGNTLILANETPIEGVTAADVAVRPGQVPEVKLTLTGGYVEIDGRAVFLMPNPRNGKMQPVTRIEFSDGTVFDPKDIHAKPRGRNLTVKKRSKA